MYYQVHLQILILFGFASGSSACQQDEIECWVQQYLQDGTPDFSQMLQMQCASASTGCPCHAVHETKCSFGPNPQDSYCMPSGEGCPIDCGAEHTCYHANNAERCAVNNACACFADEVSCPNPYPDWGASNECLPADFGACPKVCQANEITCWITDFDASGAMTHTEGNCESSTDTTEDPCGARCGNNAQKCKDAWGEWCEALTNTCPMECPEGSALSYVPIYNDAGELTGEEEKCCNMDKNGWPDCGCGANSEKCTDEWGSYCMPSGEGCPVSCNWETEILCEAQSFDANGEFLLGSAGSGTCVKQGTQCACGTNAMWCSVTDYGMTSGWCQPAAIGGVAMSCPKSCDWEKQEICSTCNYNVDGSDTGCTDTCVEFGGSCPCGENTARCTDEWGSWCMPTAYGSCPVLCTDTQKECYYNSFTAGGMFTSMQQECVASSSSCDCTKGSNAKPCTHTDPGWGTFTDCIATSDYCPPSCPSDKVTCWQVDNFDASGNYKSTTDPHTACAANLAACPCGQGAKKCGSACFPSAYECPITCTEKQQLCWIMNFDDNGNHLSENQKCVSAGEKCPCGAKSRICDGEDWCTPKAFSCACTAAQEKCIQEHFKSDGTVDSVTETCVAKGSQCPPGRNSMTCTDPDVPTIKTYHPKKTSDGKTFKCPKPCTAAEIVAGKETCYQENLDSNGEFLSESVTCVQAGGCKLGSGMKNCSIGCAVISVGESCADNYGIASCSEKAVQSSTIEKAKVVIDFSSTSGSSAVGLAAKKVKIGLDARGQPPRGIKTKVKLVTKKGPRRLKDGRKLPATGAKLVYEVENVGDSPVAPSKIAAEISKQVKAGNPKMAGYLAMLGTVNTQAGVALSVFRNNRDPVGTLFGHSDSALISGASKKPWLFMAIMTQSIWLAVHM